jgi:hypothetical protein
MAMRSFSVASVGGCLVPSRQVSMRNPAKKMPDYHCGVRRKAINPIMVFLFVGT